MRKFKSCLIASRLRNSLIVTLALLLAVFNVPVASGQNALKKEPFSGQAGAEKDDPLTRLRAARENKGESSTDSAQSLMLEAKRQRGEHPSRFSKTGEAEEAEKDVPTWRSIGPTSAIREQNGPFDAHVVDSGRLRTILVDPEDSDTVYVLSSGGGLWKTENINARNTKWKPLSDSVGTTSGGSVAFGRKPETLYLGAGDPFDVAPGGFMVKSTNGGEEWSDPEFLPGANTVLDVKVDTSGRKDIVLVGTNHGFFRSTDGGESYEQVASLSFGRNQVWSLVKTSAGWLASSQADTLGFGVPSVDTTTLYLSTDRGETWSPTGTGFSAVAGRTTLGAGAPGDKVVYAFSSTQADAFFNFDQLDLFRSADGGLTWTALGVNHSKVPTNPNFFQPDMDLMHGQAWYNQMILVDPTDVSRNTVYLGGNLSSAKSTDGGKTWKVITDWVAFFGLPYVHADLHCAAYSKSDKKLYFGSDGGIFSSTDQGVTWDNSKNTGLVDHLIYAIAANGLDPDEVLIGLQDDGTRFRLPHSTVYNQVFGGDGIGVGWSQANDNVSIASLPFDTLLFCVNNPPDQQSKFHPSGLDFLNSDYFGNFFTPVTTPTAAADPTGKVFFHFEPTTVWKSTDGANNFNLIGNIDEGTFSQPLDFVALNNIHAGPPFSMFFRDVVQGLGVNSDLSHIGVAATGGRVALSADAGNTWTIVRLNSEVPGFASFTSNVTWASKTTVYVTSINQNPTKVHVVKSTQGGAHGTWVAAQTGLPSVPVTRLLVDPRDASGDSLYAATHLGVYQTTDGGAHWQLFGTGLPQVQVTDLYTSPDGRRLEIATFGRGVWEIKFEDE